MKPDQDLIYSSAPQDKSAARPTVRGKFIFAGSEKLYLRGVTYGPFEPDESGCEYHTPDIVDRDFARMAEANINTVRTYTVPPAWLLDLAHRHGLRVMIGLPWEQHVSFLDDWKLATSIVRRVREGVRAFAGHPGLLCYAVGNEIPAPIVRWHGRARIERFLKRLYDVAKKEDPEALITYVNYPTTEYLTLDFLDFACFNVYLESRDRLEAYIARLHNVVGDTPLVLAEIGLDSLRNGEEGQADTLEWQMRSAFGQGCAGAFVFAWTDEWYRGGKEILDWDFGLTGRDRTPKQALARIREVFAGVPFPADTAWPRISVVLACYNGSATIGQSLEHLTRLDYPNYEVIVVDDGSTDGTGDIARAHGVRVIRIEQKGLSAARNTGMQAATGEIVTYIDDDAYPDPDWLHYLAHTFMSTPFSGVGGPNLTPEDDSEKAACIGEVPGNPNHVLITDTVAEHIPGVNMSFRKSCLEEIGGFDPRYRTAGDDVDICWRLQQHGCLIGFNPAAVVWHHRRPSIRRFLRQQYGYGRAEALLEQKWPEKYNAIGHVSWHGRVYGSGIMSHLPWNRHRIYQGTWGSALFQSLYQPAINGLGAILLMPESYAVGLLFGLLSILGLFWPPLLASLPLFVVISGAVLYLSAVHATRKRFVKAGNPILVKAKRWLLVAALYAAQPLARLMGRIRYGLTYLRSNSKSVSLSSAAHYLFPRRLQATIWAEDWRSHIDWLQQVEEALSRQHLNVRRSGDFDHWDMEVSSGQLGRIRILTTVEEHGTKEKDEISDQMIRLRLKPKFCRPVLIFTLLLTILSILALLVGAWVVSAILITLAGVIGYRMLRDNAKTAAIVLGTLREIADQEVEKIRIKREKKAAAKQLLEGDQFKN